MKILIDINHPAHVHFFRIPISMLSSLGHDVLITSRNKEVAVPLLDELKIDHTVLSSQKSGGGLIGLGQELLPQERARYELHDPFALEQVKQDHHRDGGREPESSRSEKFHVESAIIPRFLPREVVSAAILPVAYPNQP